MSEWQFEDVPAEEKPRPSLGPNVFERVPARFIARKRFDNGTVLVVEAPSAELRDAQIRERDAHVAARAPRAEKPAPRPRPKPLVPIDGMTQKRAEALGWKFFPVAEPRQEMVAPGLYAKSKAKASAEKRRQDGFMARNTGAGETVEAAKERLLGFILRDEQNWQAGDYRPLEVKVGVLSDQGGKVK